jgi:hypothetical protein
MIALSIIDEWGQRRATRARTWFVAHGLASGLMVMFMTTLDELRHDRSVASQSAGVKAHADLDREQWHRG